MAISIRRFYDQGGVESVVLKMDDTPVFWPNLYSTIKYRNAQKSPNTIEKVLRTIGMCYQWAQSECVDLDAELVNGDFLSIENMDSLSYFLRLKSNSQSALIAKSRPSREIKHATVESVRSIPVKSTKEAEFAGVEEIATRIRVAADYLEFHLSRRLGNLQKWSEYNDSLKKYGESTVTYLRQLTPRVRPSTQNESLEGLSENEIQVIERAFQPDSDNNPFKAGFYQHRNYLIWRLLFDTGMRRHELVGIKVEDVDYSQHRVKILVSKTMPRTVPISQTLSDHFHRYVMDYWSKLPSKKNSHGYLITRKDGHHLDEGSINLIFQTLRVKVSNIPSNLTPHSQRRTWNDRFSARIDSAASKEQISPEKEKHIRNRLMGWSSNSAQAERYAKRHIRRKADLIGEDLANQLIEREAVEDD